MSAAEVPAGAQPAALLEALRSRAGGEVSGASAGDLTGAPPVSELPEARAVALIAAWSGACLHAGAGGALRADDADLALLAGDWCFAHALQALAQDGDLEAIGVLAQAIGECALVLSEPGAAELLGPIWATAGERLAAA